MKPQKFTKFRYSLWFYFILFTLVMVAFLWVFQIVLYENLYQRDKFDDLTEIGGELSGDLNTENEINGNVINEWLDSAIAASELGISSYLVSRADNDELVIETIYSGYVNSDISNKDTDEVDLDEKKNSQSGEQSSVGSSEQSADISASEDQTSVKSSQERVSLSDRKEVVISAAVSKMSQTHTQDHLAYTYTDADGENYLVYVSPVTNRIFNGFLVMVTTELTLKENVRIIQLQLLAVSIVVILIGFFLSMYISSRISKPLDNMSQTAKEWAEGDDKAVFVADSYQELNELAEALNYAKNGLAQTGVLQRDLLANVSHDLKTPLTMIKAYAEMIRDISGEDKAKREAHTKVIIDEADRLTMLVNDILDLSKLQNNMNSLEIKETNLSELLETVLSRFGEFAKNSGYIINSNVESDLFTLCDAKKIEQVMYNLIGNSINYTGENKTINVSLTVKNNVILFETIDSGKGIGEDSINTIWDKYYRFSETHQRPIKGTGLGLNIVKTILDNHRLKYGVISKKGVGSNFFVEFNLLKDE